MYCSAFSATEYLGLYCSHLVTAVAWKKTMQVIVRIFSLMSGQLFFPNSGLNLSSYICIAAPLQGSECLKKWSLFSKSLLLNTTRKLHGNCGPRGLVLLPNLQF